MLPVNSGGHSAHQNFIVTNICKNYPIPDEIAPSTWDIIDRFGNLDLSYTDEFSKNKYSVLVLNPERLPVFSDPLCYLLILK